jgi:hypothetical protein
LCKKAGGDPWLKLFDHNTKARIPGAMVGKIYPAVNRVDRVRPESWWLQLVRSALAIRTYFTVIVNSCAPLTT